MTAILRSALVRDLGVSFNAATALFAIPLYVPLHASPGLADLLGLVLIVQVVPTVMFLAVGQGLTRGHPAIRRGYWISLGLAAVASLLRLWQQASDVGFPNLPSWSKLAAVFLIVPLVVFLVRVRADWVPNAIGRLAPVTVIVCMLFLTWLQLHADLPDAGRVTDASRRDAAFIFIFDELGRDVLDRDGAPDAELFPSFATLASDGIWVPDGTANYSPSCQSIPSMLSGRTQATCDEEFFAEGQAVLLTRLASSYRVSIYGEYLRGCPDRAEVCEGIPYLTAHYPLAGITNHLFPQSLRVGPLLDLLRARDANPYTLPLWSDFLSDVRSADLRGRAFFVHIILPHSPYAYEADGKLSRNPARSQYFYGTPDDVVAYENYRQQVRFVDGLFGSFITLLRQRDAYLTATIVVTGDHGPRLQTPPTTTTLTGIAALTPYVPLIVKSPRYGHRTGTTEYQHVDFTPTVLDAVGLPSDGFDGRSALQMGPARQKTFVTGGVMYVRSSDGSWQRRE